MIAATDGSVSGDRLGYSVVLWHPQLGIFYMAYTGARVAAVNSTEAEWLAKILLRHLLAGVEIPIFSTTNSVGLMSCDGTRPPKLGSLLAYLFRSVLSTGTIAVRESWLPAQHDSADSPLLASLNAVADTWAREGAQCSLHYTCPFLP